MMQVPGAFAASMGAYFLPPSGGHALDGRALERYLDLAVLCDLFLVRDRRSSLVPRRG